MTWAASMLTRSIGWVDQDTYGSLGMVQGHASTLEAERKPAEAQRVDDLHQVVREITGRELPQAPPRRIGFLP